MDEYTEMIAGNAPLTIKACKQIVAEVCKDPDDRDLELCKQLVDACFASEDYKEGQAGVHGEAKAAVSRKIGEIERTRKRENERTRKRGGEEARGKFNARAQRSRENQKTRKREDVRGRGSKGTG